MSDEHVENAEAPEDSGSAPELSRKEKAAARRAEFEAAKAAKATAKAEQQAAKNAEKAAATAAAREEKLAAKQAHDELRAAAKAAKEAARAAKKAKKAEKTSGGDEEDSGDVSTKGKKERRGQKEKKEKDPYRPRFAVAPVKVRAFTILAAAFAVVHVSAAVLLLSGVAPSAVPSPLVGVGVIVSLVVAGLWVASAALLCAGRVLGKHLGVVMLVLGLPLSLVTTPLLFSDDVRSWAL